MVMHYSLSLSLHKNGYLTHTHTHSLSHVFSVRRRNEETTMVTLFKVIDDIAWQFDAFHVEYLFNRMAEIPFEEYISSTLDLLKELSRLTYRAGPSAGTRLFVCEFALLYLTHFFCSGESDLLTVEHRPR